MRTKLATALLLSVFTASPLCAAGAAFKYPAPSLPDRLIFGTDDRSDRYQIRDARLLGAADAIFTFIPKEGLERAPGGKYAFKLKRTHREYLNLCPGEKFASQPAPGTFCTGFLAKPDVAVSAGHCVENDELQNFCDKYYLVFDYYMEGADSPRTTFTDSQVYACSSVLARRYEDTAAADYSILKLSRPALGRAPLKIRNSGKMADNARLAAIGHPKGLPQKFVLNSRILDNSPALFFASDIDAFHGNSGGPVLNMDTMEVEGLVIRMSGAYQGDGDYITDAARQCSKLYITTGKSSSLLIERTAAFANLLGTE